MPCSFGAGAWQAWYGALTLKRACAEFCYIWSHGKFWNVFSKMNIKSLFFFPSAMLSIAFISGCASPTVTDLRAPDGRAMKNVKCTGDSQKCMNLASDTCKDAGGTYQVIRSHSNSGGIAADIMPGPVTWYNLTFICGPSDGKIPTFVFQGQQYSPSQGGTTYTSCSQSGRSVNCFSY
jgi:hypothetical protein